MPVLRDENDVPLRTGKEQVEGLTTQWWRHRISQPVARACEFCNTTTTPSTEQMPVLFSIQEMSPAELRREFKRLKEHKAPGPDGVGPPCLRRGRDVFEARLLQYFDACLQLVHYPAPFKDAMVIALQKALD